MPGLKKTSDLGKLSEIEKKRARSKKMSAVILGLKKTQRLDQKKRALGRDNLFLILGPSGSIKFIEKTKPKCAIVENVMGIAVRSDDEALAPADILKAELKKIGYTSVTFECDLGLFHTVRRQRLVEHHVHVLRSMSFSES